MALTLLVGAASGRLGANGVTVTVGCVTNDASADCCPNESHFFGGLCPAVAQSHFGLKLIKLAFYSHLAGVDCRHQLLELVGLSDRVFTCSHDASKYSKDNKSIRKQEDGGIAGDIGLRGNRE